MPKHLEGQFQDASQKVQSLSQNSLRCVPAFDEDAPPAFSPSVQTLCNRLLSEKKLTNVRSKQSVTVASLQG